MIDLSNLQAPASRWTATYVVLWAVIPLVLGVTLGVYVRRSNVAVSPPAATAKAPHSADSAASVGPITPERLKSMADKQAAPLLAELQSHPDDPVLLAKVGNIYYVTRNFREAAAYFKRSLDLKDNPVLRTELGRASYHAGDAEGALAQFEHVLKLDPDNANALFNAGMVRWQSQFDVEGALAAWQLLLKKHPRHPRRAEVEQLIARARQHRDVKPPAQTGQPAH